VSEKKADEVQLRAIIAEQMGKSADEIDSEAHITDDIGADSLDIVEMLDRVEREFGIYIPDETVLDIRTVRDAAEYINRILDEKNIL